MRSGLDPADRIVDGRHGSHVARVRHLRAQRFTIASRRAAVPAVGEREEEGARDPVAPFAFHAPDAADDQRPAVERHERRRVGRARDPGPAPQRLLPAEEPAKRARERDAAGRIDRLRERGPWEPRALGGCRRRARPRPRHAHAAPRLRTRHACDAPSPSASRPGTISSSTTARITSRCRARSRSRTPSACAASSHPFGASRPRQ